MSEQYPSVDEVKAWRSAAGVGNVDAMVNMGLVCYNNGQLSGSDSAETWWVLAAKQDNADAMMNLGLLRYEQDRILGDEDCAESWWLLAARAGNFDAMCNLGILRQAQERLRGADSAEYWWSAAAHESEDAAFNLNALNADHPVPSSVQVSLTHKPQA